MADGLIIEFEGVARDLYDAVNAILGVDTADPNSAGWPAGLLYHAAGEKAGGAVVFEVWASKGDQERFLGETLGPALQQAGAPQPSRMEWIELLAHTSLAG
jgi:hypothetical protein